MEKRTTLDAIRNIHANLTGAYAAMEQARHAEVATRAAWEGQAERSLEFAENDLKEDNTIKSHTEARAMNLAREAIAQCRKVLAEQEARQ